nr:DUF1120 domain-containing protein [uncultured Cupriavidus sp.]
MEATLKYCSAALIAACSASVMASDTAQITVKGKLSPHSCSMNITNNGSVDVTPAASALILNQTNAAALEDKTLTLMITCSAPTRFAISTTDNRAGTHTALHPYTPEHDHYGLGTQDGKKVGSYVLSLRTAGSSGDGRDLVHLLRNAPSTSTSAWTVGLAPPQSGGVRTAPGHRQHAWAAPGGNTPSAFTVVTLPLSIKTRLTSKKELADLSNGLTIDGSATISLFYL